MRKLLAIVALVLLSTSFASAQDLNSLSISGRLISAQRSAFPGGAPKTDLTLYTNGTYVSLYCGPGMAIIGACETLPLGGIVVLSGKLTPNGAKVTAINGVAYPE